jgi:ArsR family transcriptional regulator, arsenate/arsenite/antimonite-responsive transcriptional repressor
MEIIQQCCAPVLAEPLEISEAEELAAAFKLLADPTRLRILSLIANSPGGELCACDLPGVTGKSQPTVSHHLSLLAGAGLVSRHQRGKWAWFRVEADRVEVLRRALAPQLKST